MADNSQQLLDDVLAQQRKELAPESSDQDYFELFCAEQVLKDYDLSHEEVQAGIVDGEHDGGVDSAFAFVNGELVFEDFDVSPFKKDVRIDLHIIQSKTAGGFSEIPMNRLISVTRHLLKLDADYDAFTQYSPAVKSVLDSFRRVYRELASRFPSVEIHYHYACKRAGADIHANLEKKAEELKDVARELFPDAEIHMEFLGAKRLLELARRRPKSTYELKVSKNLSDANGYIVLSPLKEYVKFLKTPDGAVRADLFESNVRDFQGTTEVNAEIVATLKDERNVDFWWMNNGVTILASRATLNGDVVTIANPQIVNGLQTSTQIARHFVGDAGDNRSVMVKIISSEDDETRDKIIKATNSQNPVQPATLRATDKVQRDIEDALKSAGLYYDRRKNYYKNEGKPADKIISIPLLAQAVMTILLGRPDSARGRPSSLIKDNTVYAQVFSEAHPIGLYANAALLMRIIDRALKARSELQGRDRSNLRFYALLWLTAMLTRKASPKAADVAAIDIKVIDGADVEAAVDEVSKLYEALGGTDAAAKGPDFRKQTIEGVTATLAAHRAKLEAPS